MGALSEAQTPQEQIAAVNDLQRSEDALRGIQGNRGDTAANQLGGGDVSFNPADEAVPAAGSSGVASIGTPDPAAGGNDWESVIDFARQSGHDVGTHTDDRSFLQSLLQAANTRKQEDYYSQLGRQYARDFVQKQQQPAAPAAPAGPQPWEAPQFDRRWLGLVDFDQNSGMFVGKPGAPAGIVDAVNTYQKWSDKYGSNPLEAVKPWAEKAVPDMVKEQVTAALANYKREQAVNGLIAGNADWMYQKDAFGAPVVGQNGRYMATPNGLRYGQYVNELERSGITDPHLVDRYAKAHLQADIAFEQQRAANNQAPAAQRQNAGAAGRAQANVRQSRGPLDAPVNEPAPDQSEMRLEDRLRQNLDAAGFGTDADFAFDQM